MKKALTFPLLAITMLVIGCSSVNVAVPYDYDQRVDFRAYKTYDWLPQSSREDPLLDKQIKTAVDTRLSAKGLQRRSADPDLLLIYHTGGEDKVRVSDSVYRYVPRSRYGSNYRRGRRARDLPTTTYHKGTLFLDFVDAKSKELVFRSSAQAVVDKNPTPEVMEREVNEAVLKMLENYPPKPSS